MAKYQFLLENGADALTFSSFLQKFIREGKKDEAYDIARMFYPRYRKYLAKRFRQCLVEEVGLANVSLYPVIMELTEKLTNETLGGEETIQKIVYLLATSKKNKWTDLAWIWHKFNPKMKNHPVKELEECQTIEDYLALFLSKFDDIKETKKLLESVRQEKDIPFLSLIGEAIHQNAQSQSCKGLGCWLYFAAQVAYIGDIRLKEITLPEGKLIDESVRVKKVPTYFHDMHTKKGKKRGCDQIHWFKECCRVDQYALLPLDFAFDPLRSGFNQEGIRDLSGIKLEYLVRNEEDLTIVESYYL